MRSFVLRPLAAAVCHLLVGLFWGPLLQGVRKHPRQPDARPLRAIHRLQTRQPNHSAVSTTASNARKCCASNPRPTSRLRPFGSRTSTRDSPAVLASPTSFTSTNCAASSPCACLGVAASRNRFFQAKKCGAHSLRAPQNAATLCPLPTCSETSFPHFAHTLLLRFCRVIPQHCYTHTRPCKMGFT
jgi:hypothetical protein